MASAATGALSYTATPARLTACAAACGHHAAMHFATPSLTATAPAGRTVDSTPHPVLRLTEDGAVVGELDIAFSTHLTLVVQARLAFRCGSAPQSIDLVVPRSQCLADRPRLRALQDAALAALRRAQRAPRGAKRLPGAIHARVAGQWQALWCAPDAMPVPPAVLG